MGVANQRIIHVKQRDPPEPSMCDAQCCRHLILRNDAGKPLAGARSFRFLSSCSGWLRCFSRCVPFLIWPTI
jgi:hypothetical protein